MQRHSIKSKVRVKSLACLGYPNYKVSETGLTVWSNWGRRGTIGSCNKLRLRLHETGRLYVSLSKGKRQEKKFFVHVLVLNAFVGPCPEGMESRHFPDPNPLNNHVNNLHWGTHKENEADKIVHGTSNRGERNGKSKLTEEQVGKIRKMYATGNYTQVELAHMNNTVQAMISFIVNHKNWR